MTTEFCECGAPKKRGSKRCRRCFEIGLGGPKDTCPKCGAVKRRVAAACRSCYEKGTPLAVRFWAKVDTGAGPDACWPWMGARSTAGYGKIIEGRAGSKSLMATHVALAFDGRPVPTGYVAMHLCDNPPCVNPRHLAPGTKAENRLDAVAKGRHAKSYAYAPRRRRRVD